MGHDFGFEHGDHLLRHPGEEKQVVAILMQDEPGGGADPVGHDQHFLRHQRLLLVAGMHRSAEGQEIFADLLQGLVVEHQPAVESLGGGTGGEVIGGGTEAAGDDDHILLFDQRQQGRDDVGFPIADGEGFAQRQALGAEQGGDAGGVAVAEAAVEQFIADGQNRNTQTHGQRSR